MGNDLGPDWCSDLGRLGSDVMQAQREGVKPKRSTTLDGERCMGEFAGKVWRIGCMAHTARPRNVTLLLGALAEVLGRR